MSSGSMDHLFFKVIDAADDMDKSTPERKWFAAHLLRVAAALKSIEWEDSGDTSEEATTNAIRAVMRIGTEVL